MNKVRLIWVVLISRVFLALMKVDFLNQAVKLVNINLHADGRVFMKCKESCLCDVSPHIWDVGVTVYILQTGPNFMQH